MSKRDVIRILRETIKPYPNHKEAARALRVSPSALSATLKGRIDPPPKVLKALKLRRRLIYEPLEAA